MNEFVCFVSLPLLLYSSFWPMCWHTVKHTEHIEHFERGEREKTSQWTLKYSEESAFKRGKKWEKYWICSICCSFGIVFCLAISGSDPELELEEKWTRKVHIGYGNCLWRVSVYAWVALVCLPAWYVCACAMRASFDFGKIFIQRLAFIGRCRPFRINLEISYTESIFVSISCCFYFASVIYSLSYGHENRTH